MKNYETQMTQHTAQSTFTMNYEDNLVKVFLEKFIKQHLNGGIFNHDIDIINSVG